MDFEKEKENKNKNEDDDDCEILFEIIKSTLQIFIQSSRQYYKLDPRNENSKEIFKEKEHQLELIIENLQKKYSYFTKIKNCKIQEHQKLAFEIDHMIEDNKRKINSFYKQKNENFLILKNRKFEEKEIEIENLINSEEKENNFDDTNHNEVNQQQILLNKDLINGNLEEIDIFTLEEIIDKNSKEYKGDKIFQRNLVKFKHQIQELQNHLNFEVEKSGQQIDNITNDISVVSSNVDVVNEDLRKAALDKNKVSNIKYPVILGGVGTTLGTVVPGIGNIIGGSLGTLLGIGLAKLEKRQIKKIEWEKYKEKNKK